MDTLAYFERNQFDTLHGDDYDVRIKNYCAAAYGYTHLVLGAWGWGAFGNDSETVAALFRDAIDNFRYNGTQLYPFAKVTASLQK